MEYTVLQIVQKVLSAMNSDFCSSIEDEGVTEEALQVAEIVKDTYTHLLLTRDIKTKQSIIILDVLSDVTKPTYLQFTDDIIRIEQFSYKDSTGAYKKLYWKEPLEFINHYSNLDPSGTSTNLVSCVDFSGITFKIAKDKDPQYWTTLDNHHIILDSFDNTVESSIQASKTLAYGEFIPEFKLEDAFIPNIAPAHFPLLISASKVAASSNLKRNIDAVEADRMKKQLMVTDKLAKRTSADLSTNLFYNTSKGGKRSR